MRVFKSGVSEKNVELFTTNISMSFPIQSKNEA